MLEIKSNFYKSLRNCVEKVLWLLEFWDADYNKRGYYWIIQNCIKEIVLCDVSLLKLKREAWIKYVCYIKITLILKLKVIMIYYAMNLKWSLQLSGRNICYSFLWKIENLFYIIVSELSIPTTFKYCKII